MIDWSPFSWEAFATLVTGLAAVIGAVIVGRRQLSITERQTEILEKQVALEEKKLSHDLYDRRFAVLRAVAKMLNCMMVPQNVDDVIRNAFVGAQTESHFLFNGSFHHELQLILDYNLKREMLLVIIDTDRSNGAESDPVTLQQYGEINEWVTWRAQSITDLFEEMKLG